MAEAVPLLCELMNGKAFTYSGNDIRKTEGTLKDVVLKEEVSGILICECLILVATPEVNAERICSLCWDLTSEKKTNKTNSIFWKAVFSLSSKYRL